VRRWRPARNLLRNRIGRHRPHRSPAFTATPFQGLSPEPAGSRCAERRRRFPPVAATPSKTPQRFHPADPKCMVSLFLMLQRDEWCRMQTHLRMRATSLTSAYLAPSQHRKQKKRRSRNCEGRGAIERLRQQLLAERSGTAQVLSSKWSQLFRDLHRKSSRVINLGSVAPSRRSSVSPVS